MESAMQEKPTILAPTDEISNTFLTETRKFETAFAWKESLRASCLARSTKDGPRTEQENQWLIEMFEYLFDAQLRGHLPPVASVVTKVCTTTIAESVSVIDTRS
jgi:hypothetical protein